MYAPLHMVKCIVVFLYMFIILIINNKRKRESMVIGFHLHVRKSETHFVIEIQKPFPMAIVMRDRDISKQQAMILLHLHTMFRHPGLQTTRHLHSDTDASTTHSDTFLQTTVRLQGDHHCHVE